MKIYSWLVGLASLALLATVGLAADEPILNKNIKGWGKITGAAHVPTK